MRGLIGRRMFFGGFCDGLGGREGEGVMIYH